MYSWILPSNDVSPARNRSINNLNTNAESLVHEKKSTNVNVPYEADQAHSQGGSFLLGLATTTPGFAPCAFAPFAPTLSRRPCRAFVLSELSHDSREDWRGCRGPASAEVKPVARTSRLLRFIILIVLPMFCSCWSISQVERKSSLYTQDAMIVILFLPFTCSLNKEVTVLNLQWLDQQVPCSRTAVDATKESYASGERSQRTHIIQGSSVRVEVMFTKFGALKCNVLARYHKSYLEQIQIQMKAHLSAGMWFQWSDVTVRDKCISSIME